MTDIRVFGPRPWLSNPYGPGYLVGMGVNFRSSVLAWTAAMGILALLAAPWVLRFVQERFPPTGALPPSELQTEAEEPRMQHWREEEERHGEGLNGKVLSNTATEEEIREYYAHRRKVSEELLTFTRRMLEEYGAELPEAERGLYERSLHLHHTRLEELSHQARAALDRRRGQLHAPSGSSLDIQP